MDDRTGSKPAPERPDPSTALYKRVVEQARTGAAVRKKPATEGEAIGRLGDQVGGPA